MKPAKVIEEKPSEALVVRRDDQQALGRAMSLDELHRNLEFVRDVMRKEMRDGTDFGKIPGCGEKPTLLQPGAQKLLMTFNLTERVSKEEVKEYPGFHREYAFTITVMAPNGKEWDGVGTCSTLESKYRYRQGGRKCPECGKETIIKGDPKFGGGWVCWKKKGGCGWKCADGTEPSKALHAQEAERKENENPPDNWNTVRKMAFKRALVSAAINATNTSELWTQDLEDNKPQNGASTADTGITDFSPDDFENLPKQKPSDRHDATTSKRTPASSGAGHPSSPAPEKPLPIANAPKHASAKTRQWMIEHLNAHMGGEGRVVVEDYFRKLGWLMPNEALEELPLRFVPINQKQLKALQSALNGFVDGLEAEKPYEQNPEPTAEEKEAGDLLESEDWKSFPVPFGKDSGKTLGSLDGKKVFGWAMNFKVETEYKGKPRPENKITLDKAFRKALDAAAVHYGWDLTKGAK